MDQTTTLKKYFETAPDEIRLVIQNLKDKPEVITDIATRNNIEPIKVGSLSCEILLTLLGIEYFSDFRKNLIQELGITYDQALKITTDVNEKIFAPVIETLKKMEVDVKDFIQKGGSVDSQAKPAIVSTPVPAAGPAKTEPEKLIPDHAEMLRTDGPHLHSQNVMPVRAPAAATARPTATPAPTAAKSIVDQKLRGIVHSTNQTKPEGYKGQDPYREPLK